MSNLTSIIAAVTRCRLTRSFSPFAFKASKGDTAPFYSDCDNMGLYIHIPFCARICSFCPYCKEQFSEEKCRRYIDCLIREIHTACAGAPKKRVTSLYFGGGTPALAANRLKEIILAVGEHFDITEGIGAELHPDNVNEGTLALLKEAGVTKISIGIQSFEDKFLSVLGRRRFDSEKLSEALNGAGFETVSMDFIFALPGQTAEDLKRDIDTAFSCGANHIAIYPFIDFTFTDSPLKAMPKAQKRALLDEITLYCAEKGLRRDSIWTFSNNPTAKYSSMTRESFLGFGCSAATLLRDSFRINTFSVEEYCRRIDSGLFPTSLELHFSRRQRMVYWLFWSAYSTSVSSADFERFFGVPLESCYGAELWLAQKLGLITARDGVYSMTAKGAFYYHYYENYYTLSYIDKMWGIMRKQAFPEKLKL